MAHRHPARRTRVTRRVSPRSPCQRLLERLDDRTVHALLALAHSLALVGAFQARSRQCRASSEAAHG